MLTTIQDALWETLRLLLFHPIDVHRKWWKDYKVPYLGRMFGHSHHVVLLSHVLKRRQCVLLHDGVWFCYNKIYLQLLFFLKVIGNFLGWLSVDILKRGNSDKRKKTIGTFRKIKPDLKIRIPFSLVFVLDFYFTTREEQMLFHI